MDITLQYQPNAKELAKASSLFLEKKPFLLYSVGLINILISVILILTVLKFVFIEFHLKELVVPFICLIWLFGRRPFNEWLLYLRMKRSIILEKPITITITHNGIVWSGKGLRPGNMGWDHVKYILEAKNGFVMPNSFTKFLWIPLRAFGSPEDIQAFKNIIIEKKIVHRIFYRWQC
jgi:hypothetical protein